MTGIDLNQPFVEVATMLTARCGLSESVTFLKADALDLPFEDKTFDQAWTQHVAMNIGDRRKLYSETSRVMKPAGRMAIYDVVAGDGRPLTFPVPWVRGPEMSFLLTSEEMRELLEQTGFSEASWIDKTEISLTWFNELQTRLSSSPPLSLTTVMGPEFLEMARNLGRNLQDGRVRIVQAIFRLTR